jgi:hypothetical protein
MLLVCSFCFLDATFLEVTTSNNASFQFVAFADCSLFGFEYKFNGDNEFVLMRSFAKDKGTMVNEVLDFHAVGGGAASSMKVDGGWPRLAAEPVWW